MSEKEKDQIEKNESNRISGGNQTGGHFDRQGDGQLAMMVIKQKPGMVTKSLGDDEYMVVPTVGENVNRVLSLNGSGGFVWLLLEQARSFDELMELLSGEYDAEPAELRADLVEFLNMIGDYIDRCPAPAA